MLMSLSSQRVACCYRGQGWVRNFHDALQTAPLSGAAYHLTNPHRTSLATLTGFLRSAGYELTDYPLTRWAALIRDQPGNAALSVLDIFLREMTAGGWSDLVLSNASTRRALGDNDPGCPELTAGLFGTYLRYFTSTGYLPASARDT
jgi:hypothetical protein